MRLTALLLLVVGSAQCFNIELHNLKKTPITVETYHNNGLVNAYMPAAVNGVPSNWTMTGVGAYDVTTFQSGHFYVKIRPSSIFPGNNPPWIDLTAQYQPPADLSSGMAIYLPGFYPKAQFTCNFPTRFVCTDPDNGHSSDTMTYSISYTAFMNTKPFQIYYKDLF